jgi:MFS superfamily sulfate permease-like transporter
MLFNGNVKLSAVITSIICFIILIFFDVINRILKKKIRKIPVYIPGQLIVVVLAIGISYGADLHDNFGLPTIIDSGGILPGSCFKPTIPDHTLILAVLPEAFAIAIIGFVINIAQAKLLAQKNCYSIHPNQELLAYGVMNMGGAFFGSFPTAGALSRTVLQDATGGHTQLVSFISSFVVLLVILFLGFLFGPLPNAAVSVIVIMALKGLFLQVRDVRRYFYLHWPDMIVWLVVFISTLIIGLDIGLAIGVFCSIFIVVIQTML